MRVGLSAGLDPTQENSHDRTGHGLQKPELLAQVGQGLDPKKTTNLKILTQQPTRRSHTQRQTLSGSTLTKVDGV